MKWAFGGFVSTASPGRNQLVGLKKNDFFPFSFSFFFGPPWTRIVRPFPAFCLD